MNNIYIGDIVYLVYGSHPMMVEKLQDNLATCIWFSEALLHKDLKLKLL